MSKKGYSSFATLEYRVEHIALSKQRLKKEACKKYRQHGLIYKRIAKKRKEENLLWNKLHEERRIAQNKGKWDYNFERVM